MKKKITTEMYIESVNLVHKYRYNYTKTIYTRAEDQVIVTCPIHGDFSIRAAAHLRGDNCGKCKGKYYDATSFIEIANKQFNYYFDYTNVIYNNSKTKVIITCPIHGDFKQTPSNHLKSNLGCPSCSKDVTARKRAKSKEQFISQASKLHSNKYVYDNSTYIRGEDYITIWCPKPNHGYFSIIANNHLCGQGCPCCTNGGFKMDKPAILYYLSINNGQAYKIGITNRSIKERFSNKDHLKIQILHQIHYQIGKMAYDEEQRLLKEFKMYKYNGPNLLESGNTELFNRDVLCR